MAQKSNLTIEVLSIIGGVLTAIFFLGFLVLSSILRSETSCLIAGSILIITTLFVNRLLTKPFLDAMNITCYIAGCILAGYGMNRNMDVLFIVLIGISVVTMLLSKGFILTFLSVISFYMALFGEITNLFSYSSIYLRQKYSAIRTEICLNINLFIPVCSYLVSFHWPGCLSIT